MQLRSVPKFNGSFFDPFPSFLSNFSIFRVILLADKQTNALEKLPFPEVIKIMNTTKLMRGKLIVIGRIVGSGQMSCIWRILQRNSLSPLCF